MRLLLVDDEVNFVNALKQTLTEQHMIVDTAYDGNTGLDLALSDSYDLLIVDVMMPGISGFELVKQLREAGQSTPTLLLTAKDAVEDRVQGLDEGADDYLVKPFATKELLARIRALTRRNGNVVGVETLVVGDFALDLVARVLTFRDQPLQLTTKEFQLLELFLRNPGRVLPKVLLLDRVWGFDSAADPNIVEIYVHSLRKKLGGLLNTDNSGHGDSLQSSLGPLIETVRGVGYAFRGN